MAFPGKVSLQVGLTLKEFGTFDAVESAEARPVLLRNEGNVLLQLCWVTEITMDEIEVPVAQVRDAN